MIGVWLPSLIAAVAAIYSIWLRRRRERGGGMDTHELIRFCENYIGQAIHQLLSRGSNDVQLMNVDFRVRNFRDLNEIVLSFSNEFHFAFTIPRDLMIPEEQLRRIIICSFNAQIAERISNDEQRRMAIRDMERLHREALRRVWEMPNEMLNGLVELVHTYPPGTELNDRFVVQERAKELLREHLNPKQLKQFDEVGAFIVIAPSGNAYRIDQRETFNVTCVLTEVRYCFVPEGNLAIFDRMLAQKIALETRESEALWIANRNDEGGRR